MFTERQVEIIYAAANLIDEKGIQGLTMKNLSKKIGISEPAIYRHYENKIDILVNIIDYFTGTISEIFDIQISSEDHALLRIEKIFENYFLAFANLPSLITVIFSEEIFRNEPLLTQKVKEVMTRSSQNIHAIIVAGQARQEINPTYDADDLVILILGSIRLLVKQWQMANYSFDMKQRGAKFFESLRKILIS